MKYDAVILDWAGTTIDYGCFAPVQAFIDAFEEYGITPTLQEVREPMGMLKIDHIRRMLSMERISNEWVRLYGSPFTEEDVKRIYRFSEKRILQLLPDFTDVKPYVLETIKELRNMGIKIGSTTGYTDEMMQLVIPKAAAQGYQPDCWISSTSLQQHGRPYPYMIFRNMEQLELTNVHRIIKVGDTISDITEGKNAGVISVGIIEGSSLMGLSQKEYEALPMDEKNTLCEEVKQKYLKAGADYVIKDIRGVLELFSI